MKQLRAIVLLFTVLSCTREQNIVPPYLQAGDTIGVVSISYSLHARASRLDSVLNVMSEWGLCVKKAEHIYDTAAEPFPAGDRERAADLQQMIDNDNIKAIIFLRGGYGAVRTLDYLDFSSMKKHPKWVVGFSDLTVIHNKMRNIGVQSLHGPTAACLDPDMTFDTTGNFLREALFGQLREYKTAYDPDNIQGKATGEIVGGNLNLLASSIGTDYDINMDGGILFIEDVEEPMYKIDSYLQQLKRSGKLKGIKGLIFGDFSDISEKDIWNRSLRDLLKEYAKELNVPTVFGFPAGHEYLNYPLYLGRKTELTISENGTKLEFL